MATLVLYEGEKLEDLIDYDEWGNGFITINDIEVIVSQTKKDTEVIKSPTTE